MQEKTLKHYIGEFIKTYKRNPLAYIERLQRKFGKKFLADLFELSPTDAGAKYGLPHSSVIAYRKRLGLPRYTEQHDRVFNPRIVVMLPNGPNTSESVATALFLKRFREYVATETAKHEE